MIRRWRRRYHLDRASPPPRRMGRPPRLARPAREELERLAIHQGHSDQDLAGRYGCSPTTIESWRRAFGLVRPQHRIDRDRVLTLLRQGLPAYQIAEQVGCTTRHIYKIAKTADIPLGTHGRPRAPRRDRADRERVLAMWRQGVPVEQIAEAVDRKPATIYKIAQAARAYMINGQRPSLPSSRNRKRTSPSNPSVKTTGQLVVPMQREHRELAAQDDGEPLLPSDQQTLVGAAPSRNDHDHRRQQTDRLARVQALTTAEVAGLFWVSQQAVRQWASHHKLPWVWVQGRRRYPAAAVAQLAQEHSIPLPDWLPAATATHQEPV